MLAPYSNRNNSQYPLQPVLNRLQSPHFGSGLIVEKLLDGAVEKVAEKVQVQLQPKVSSGFKRFVENYLKPAMLRIKQAFLSLLEAIGLRETKGLFHDFSTKMAEYNLDARGLLQASLAEGNPVIASGTFSSFMNIPVKGMEGYGLKILDEAPKDGFSMMFSRALGMAAEDPAPARLKAIAEKLAAGGELKLVKVKSRIPHLADIGQDVAHLTNAEGKVLAVVQNKIPGRVVNGPLRASQAMLHHFVDSSAAQAKALTEHMGRHASVLEPLLEKFPVIEDLMANPKALETIHNRFPHADIKAVMAKLDEPFLKWLDELCQPKGLNFAALLDKTPQDVKRIQKLSQVLFGYKQFTGDYLKHLESMAALPPEAFEHFIASLEVAKRKGVRMDIRQHSNNILYDAASRRFGMVDVQTVSGAVPAGHEPYHFKQLVPTLFERYNHTEDVFLLPELIHDPKNRAKAVELTQQLLKKLFGAAEKAKVKLNEKLYSQEGFDRILKFADFKP